MLQLIWALRLIAASKQEDRGATAVEYGLMVSLIAIVIIAAVTLIGTNLATIFSTVAAAL